MECKRIHVHVYAYYIIQSLMKALAQCIKVKLLVYLVIGKESFVCLKGEPREVMGGGDGG